MITEIDQQDLEGIGLIVEKKERPRSIPTSLVWPTE